MYGGILTNTLNVQICLSVHGSMLMALLSFYTGRGEGLTGQLLTIGFICPLSKKRVCLSVVLVAAGHGAGLRRGLVNG